MNDTTTETTEKPAVRAVDLSSLGRGLYTETVTIDPTVDGNAPARPVDEANFDDKGVEVSKIIYKAMLTPPAADATDFDGNARPFVEDISGVYKKGDNAGKPYKALKLNFDLKIAEFADVNANQRALQGRAGKSQEMSLNTFTKMKDGVNFSPLFDFAVRLGIATPPAKNADGSPTTVNVDSEELITLVAQHIASGQAVVGVTVKWVYNWIKSSSGNGGKYEVSFQRNFPKDAQGLHQPIPGTKVKVNTFERL